MRTKKFLQNQKNKSILKKFLICYLFVLIIPLIFGTISYNFTFGLVNEQSIDLIISSLERTKDNIDMQIKRIDNLTLQLSMSDEVNELLYLNKPQYGSSDIWKIVKSSKYIDDFLNDDIPIIKNFYIFFKNNEIILSKNRINIGFPFHYETNFYYENMDYQTWYNTMFSHVKEKTILPSMTVTDSNSTYSSITYLQPIPFRFYNESEAIVVFLINEKELCKPLLDVFSERGGRVQIFDANNNVISSTGIGEYCNKESIKFNTNRLNGYFRSNILGDETMTMYTVSAYNGWKYVIDTPAKGMMERVSFVQKVIIVCLILILLIGGFVSYLMSYYNTKPVKDIISMLNGFNKKGNLPRQNMSEYELIRCSVTELIRANNSVNSAYTNQSHILKTVLINSLFSGEMNNIDDINIILNNAKLDLKGIAYQVLVLHIQKSCNPITEKTLEELSMKKNHILEILEVCIDDSCELVHLLNQYEINLIMCFKTGEMNQWFARTDAIIADVNSKIDVNYKNEIVYGIGNIYHDLTCVHHSYDEAHKAIEYCKCHKLESQIIWYNQIPKANEVYYYPLEVEVQLLNTTRAGNDDDVTKIFKTIYEENYINRNISIDMKKLLNSELNCTLIKLTHKVDVTSSTAASDFDNNESGVFACFEHIQKLFKTECEWNEKNKKSHNTNLINQILEYIEFEYIQVNICAYDIAKKFNLSESYFSQFFKEQTGVSFSNYLERIRIQHACNKLAESDMNIKDIAESVGYHNPQTFRRAFKRVVGVLPNNYKLTNLL